MKSILFAQNPPVHTPISWLGINATILQVQTDFLKALSDEVMVVYRRSVDERALPDGVRPIRDDMRMGDWPIVKACVAKDDEGEFITLDGGVLFSPDAAAFFREYFGKGNTAAMKLADEEVPCYTRLLWNVDKQFQKPVRDSYVRSGFHIWNTADFKRVPLPLFSPQNTLDDVMGRMIQLKIPINMVEFAGLDTRNKNVLGRLMVE